MAYSGADLDRSPVLITGSFSDRLWEIWLFTARICHWICTQNWETTQCWRRLSGFPKLNRCFLTPSVRVSASQQNLISGNCWDGFGGCSAEIHGFAPRVRKRCGVLALLP